MLLVQYAAAKINLYLEITGRLEKASPFPVMKKTSPPTKATWFFEQQRNS